MDGRRARKLLGVARDADADEVKRAFRARALVVHPDHGGSATAFAELCSAFDLLRFSAHTPVVPAALPRTGPRVDVYDSPWRPAPRREFADVLRAASARLR